MSHKKRLVIEIAKEYYMMLIISSDLFWLDYIVLEQCQAGVDMLGHRLVHIKRMDLTNCLTRRAIVADGIGCLPLPSDGLG